jgi:replication-associated recombination protein RarA
MNLTEKYLPRTINDFAGLARPKAILAAFAKQPYSAAFLFVGPSGIGKTTMAMALAEQINGEVHHISSRPRNCGLVSEDVLVHSHVGQLARPHN